MAVGSPHMGHSAPIRGDKRTKASAHGRTEQLDKLIDCVRKASRRTHFLDDLSALIPKEALDDRPVEWADVVDCGTAVAGVP